MEGTSINYDFISTQLFSLATSVAFTGTLLVLMMCDIAIGTIVAWTDKKISSSTSFHGIGKKVIMLIAVGVGAAVGKEANMPLGHIIAGYYCVTELWSIVENMAMAGVPFPPQVVDVLEKLNPGVKRNTLPNNSSPLPSEEKAEPK